MWLCVSAEYCYGYMFILLWLRGLIVVVTCMGWISCCTVALCSGAIVEGPSTQCVEPIVKMVRLSSIREIHVLNTRTCMHTHMRAHMHTHA